MTKQVYRCPKCGFEYLSPIRVTAVYCPNSHKNIRRDVLLELLEER